MNKLKGSLAAKILAIILLATSCLMICGALVGITWLGSEGAYSDKSIENVREDMIENRLQTTCFELLDRMQVTPVNMAYDNSVRFELLDRNGNVLAGNFHGDESVLKTHIVYVGAYLDGIYFIAEDLPLTAHGDLSLTSNYNDGLGVAVGPVVTPTPTPHPTPEATVVPAPAVTPTPAPEPAVRTEESAEAAEAGGTRVWKMRLYWTQASESAETDTEIGIYEQLYPHRYSLIAVGAFSFLIAILLFVFLMASAGHHDASGEIKAGMIERIPFDLLLFMSIIGAGVLIMLIEEMFNSRQIVMSLVIAAICLIMAGLLTLMCLMSAAVRLKLKTLLSSCLIWRVLRWSWKWLQRVFSAVADLLHGVPLIWKWVPLYAVLLIIDLWLTFTFRRDSDMLGFVFLLRWAVIAAEMPAGPVPMMAMS